MILVHIYYRTHNIIKIIFQSNNLNLIVMLYFYYKILFSFWKTNYSTDHNNCILLWRTKIIDYIIRSYP